jgi:hypothetical protein
MISLGASNNPPLFIEATYLINNFYLCCTLLNDAFYVTQDYIALNVRMTGER